ncbi:cytochrome P450 2J4 isoform X3 [Amia ocellicauda]|uniref:cytochrome P450 2J4 isoform X3 n=1 Tax=Amia ocellicauda TaxID=2972642 RepID=UPI0034643049
MRLSAACLQYIVGIEGILQYRVDINCAVTWKAVMNLSDVAPYWLWQWMDIQGLLMMLCVFLIVKTIRDRPPRNYPPGPFGLPVIGSLLCISPSDPFGYFCKLLGDYGDIMSLSVGNMPILLLSGSKTLREAFVEKADAFTDHPLYPINKRLCNGLGLIWSNGQMWKQQRRFALSTLKYFGVGKKTLETSILEENRVLYKAIRNEQCKPFEPHNILHNAVGNIISSLVFGHRFEYDDGHFHEMLRICGEIFQLPFTLWGRCEDHTSGFNEENLLYCVLDLIAAGTETTSNTLLWGLLYMAKYPEIQEKVQDEIDGVIGQERQPSMDDRPSMPYTYAVIHEIQRFGNIVPFTPPRMSNKNTTLAGYDIPKGVIVLPMLMPILFDKSEYQTADQFNPEHFLDKEGKFVKRDNFMPFSIGKRACPGEQLARMELFLFFTSFLQRFTFCAPQGVELTMEFVIGITRGPKPFKICAVPRIK